MHASPEAIRYRRRQVRKQYVHSKEAIEWLSEPNPVYSCGTPVSKHDVQAMLTTHRLQIAYIEKHQAHYIDGLRKPIIEPAGNNSFAALMRRHRGEE